MKSSLNAVGVTMIILLLTSGIIPLISRSNPLEGDTLIRVTVKINDTIQQDSLYLLVTPNGALAEVKQLMQLVGGEFTPFSHIFHQYGFMVQYGRYISYTRLNFNQGFVNLQLVDILPPTIAMFIGSDSVYFAPLMFLAQAINGTVTYDAIAGQLEITKETAPDIGSVFPPAKPIAEALSNSGYSVLQGELSKQNPIDFCLAGYTPNANGNNAGVPYFGIQVPPYPYWDSLYSAPIVFTFNPDEAMVIVGRTPPECIYYSYRSYLMNRLYTFPYVTGRTKINASLGDMTSLYRMRPDLPLDSMFDRKFALIMAGDSMVAMNIRQIILASTPEIATADIHFDILPSDGMFRFGQNPQADWGNFLHRVSLFKDTAAQRSYMDNPPVEILRVTPLEPPPPVPFKLASFLPRTCGVNEFDLLPDLSLVEEGIYEAWHANYLMIWLQPSPWVIEGFSAIQQGMDALGDNHDALYILTSDFQFRENDIALVYGVDHVKTGKAVYTNATIYGKKYLTGFGGITNFMMEKSARQYVADTAIADRFYAWCFSRHPIPGNPNVYIVPSDTHNILEGINVNDTANIGFRLYVNTLTKIGPDPLEVILDQTVLMRPFNTGISENMALKPSTGIKVYPNPVTEKATLEFTVPEWSDVTLMMYNTAGQQVGQPCRIDHVKGTVVQEMRRSGNMSDGTYFLRAVVNERQDLTSYALTGTILFIGGTIH